MQHREQSELLKLLASRKAWDIPCCLSAPLFNDQDKDRNEAAALMWGVANDSDPFAASRARLHINQGYELASDVMKDAARLHSARKGQHKRFLEKNGYA